MGMAKEQASKELNLERLRTSYRKRLRSVDELVLENVAQGNYIRALGVVGEWGAGAEVSLAMMDWLMEEHPAGTREHLINAAELVPQIARPISGRPLIDWALEEYSKYTDVYRINGAAFIGDGPLCLIAAGVLTNSIDDRFTLLVQFAPLITEHSDDDYSSLDALGLLAAISDDKALEDAFAFRMQRYLGSKWCKPFFRANMEQIAALIARDQVALDAATQRAAEQFLQRAKDKKTLGIRLGLGIYSHINFDLIGVTVGKLALSKGMQFDHDSRAIPRGVVTLF